MFVHRPSFLCNEAAGGAPTGAGAAPVVVTPPAPVIQVPPAPVAPPPAAPPPAPAPPPSPPAPPEAGRDPSWFNDRIAQAKKSAQSSLLKELGVTSLDEAKTAITERNAKTEAEKSVAQKAAEYERDLKATKKQNEALSASIGVYATAQMATLNDAQKAAVTAIAGDDPAKQLATIEALRPTWSAQGAPPAASPPAGAPAAQPPVPQVPPTAPIKDTAPGQTAPKDAGNTTPPDPKALYEEIKKTNPVIAARFALVHGLHDVSQ